MSNPSRKHRSSKKQVRPPKQKKAAPAKQQSKKQILVFALIAILAVIPFSMGKYFELNYSDPYDSGANVYSAKHILDGARIGIEEKTSAAWATLLVNILGVWLFGFSEFGPKLLQGLAQGIALVTMFYTMRKLFGTLAAAVGVIIASVYLSAPLIAKFGNVKDQFMTALMITGISLFVLRQLDGKWWLSLLSGMFLSWAPLFKPTGCSAIVAMGLFVILQPLLKNRTLKQTCIDILLLLAGAIIAIAPLYIWIIVWDVHRHLPYSFVWRTIGQMLRTAGAVGAEQAKAAGGYVATGRKLVPFSRQWPRVLRYYGLLILPIALATGAILARIVRMISHRLRTQQNIPEKKYDRFVLLFALWWVLDMAFVWISPRSYEQYYLALNGSAAMLGGYLIALYSDKLSTSPYKGRWLAVGFLGLLAMIAMSWHIFFGIEKSPHSGAKYRYKRKGYAQRLREVNYQRRHNLKYPWEIVGEYIRANSIPSDKIYVWGWMPGIYVKAQRFSSAGKACTLPRPTPKVVVKRVAEFLKGFEEHKPKFIVDSRKNHIPLERPPYELWPIVPKGFMGAKKADFLPLNKNIIATYDAWYSAMLRERFDEDEALRYEAMKPFREYIMKNYKIVRTFGQHVLFERK